METKPNLFKEIETEVAKLHSFETFVLEALPVTKISKEAKVWLNEETIDD